MVIVVVQERKLGLKEKLSNSSVGVLLVYPSRFLVAEHRSHYGWLKQEWIIKRQCVAWRSS